MHVWHKLSSDSWPCADMTWECDDGVCHATRSETNKLILIFNRCIYWPFKRDLYLFLFFKGVDTRGNPCECRFLCGLVCPDIQLTLLIALSSFFSVLRGQMLYCFHYNRYPWVMHMHAHDTQVTNDHISPPFPIRKNLRYLPQGILRAHIQHTGPWITVNFELLPHVASPTHSHHGLITLFTPDFQSLVMTYTVFMGGQNPTKWVRLAPGSGSDWPDLLESFCIPV